VPDPLKRDLVLRIPFTTLVKVALFLLLVFVVSRLLPLLAIIYVAGMVAVVMAAATEWLTKRGLAHALALTLVSVVVFGAVILFLVIIVPHMVAELRQLVTDMPRIAQRLDRELPAVAPYIRSVAAQIKTPSELRTPVIAGWYAVEAITALFLMLVLAVFFVVEGKRALAWLFSFAPERQRRKLVQTVDEVEPVMLGYMRGQLIISSLAAMVVMITLSALHVPAALPVAVLTFVADFFPIIGFIATIVPAALLALVVSPIAAAVVVVVYGAYHLFEAYYLVPRVFGGAMRLSLLTVLLAFSAGALLAGPIGAILILPIAAAYPAIERIWLRLHLAPDTVPKHEAIEGKDEEQAERVAEEVMRR
jgi:predicted PurR-regulated permease PerM